MLFHIRALRHGPELPGTAGGPRRPSGKGLSRQGMLIDTTGPLSLPGQMVTSVGTQTWAQFARDTGGPLGD